MASRVRSASAFSTAWVLSFMAPCSHFIDASQSIAPAPVTRYPPAPMTAITLALLLLAADPAPLDASTRDYDQVHLVVRVSPRIAEGVVDGETTVSFASLADPLKVLRLHCQETAVTSVKDGAGAALEHSLDGGILSIALAAPLPRGAAGAVTVAYRSRPTRGMYFHAPTPESP